MSVSFRRREGDGSTRRVKVWKESFLSLGASMSYSKDPFEKIGNGIWTECFWVGLGWLGLFSSRPTGSTELSQNPQSHL